MYHGIDAVRALTDGRDRQPECANQSRLATPLFPHDDTNLRLCTSRCMYVHSLFQCPSLLNVLLMRDQKLHASLRSSKVHLMPKNFDSFYKRLCRTRYGNAQRGIFVQNNITEILYRVTYGQVPPQTRKYVTRVSGAGNQKSLKSTRTRKLQIAEMECSSVKCTGYVRIVCPGKCRDDRNNEA
ncbi:hypothetical protein Y032_0523g2909 [Ancylostoma ceylanicum]|uniref:Uncharacterized protein n=1 Tax=Ancylostoma ceylanicum TaxID=53326 RepID=A0A016WS40_9BILA|nr:hypothetical protein Y032_0523g2909 [Ancylostoma ceylanicum]